MCVTSMIYGHAVKTSFIFKHIWLFRHQVFVLQWGVGGYTDQHRSALKLSMFQRYLHYEGWEGVSNFQKKALHNTRMAPIHGET